MKHQTFGSDHINYKKIIGVKKFDLTASVVYFFQLDLRNIFNSDILVVSNKIGLRYFF
jgi:hypothetical protein